jgi:hypothetical protein
MNLKRYCLVFFFLALTVNVFAQSVSMYVTAKGGLHVRSEPSVSGAIVHTLVYGEQVSVVPVKRDTVNGITSFWYSLYNDRGKYVFGGYLSATLPADLPQIIGVWKTDKEENGCWSFSLMSYGNILHRASYGIIASDGGWQGSWNLSGDVLTISRRHRGGWGADPSPMSDMVMTIKFIDANTLVLRHKDGTVETIRRWIK